MLGAEDVIIRDVRVRVGDRGLSGQNDVSDGMGLTSGNHGIIDHCSIAWGTDEGFSSRNAQNITLQWTIIAESLHDSIHYGPNHQGTETHAFAASISGFTGSFHHNLLVDCTGRNWSLAGGMEQDAITYGGQVDIRNNVVYNWMDRTTDGGARRINFVNNYYKTGAASNTGLHIIAVDGNELNTYDMQKAYVSGNIMTDYSDNQILRATDNAWDKGKAKSGGKNPPIPMSEVTRHSLNPMWIHSLPRMHTRVSLQVLVQAAHRKPDGTNWIHGISRKLKKVHTPIRAASRVSRVSLTARRMLGDIPTVRPLSTAPMVCATARTTPTVMVCPMPGKKHMVWIRMTLRTVQGCCV